MIKGVVVGETKIILQRGNIRGNSLKNNMKISQFIIATEQDDNPNTYLLYNTHTTAFVADVLYSLIESYIIAQQMSRRVIR